MSTIQPQFPENDKSYSTRQRRVQKEEDIKLEDISIMYTTELQEDERSTFDETFEQEKVKDTKFGEEFLDGLKDNKKTLMEKLKLTDEEYDSMACIALALASQETGMGEEAGYKDENTGIAGFFRSAAKLVDSWLGNGSASSGITQVKIHDFLNSDKLTDEQKKILKDLGIESQHAGSNNLYNNPDKAAIATMVVLKSISDKYDDYQKVLKDSHSAINSKLNDRLSDEEKLNKGNEILNDIKDIYKNATDAKKKEIRSTFKQWLLSQNDSKASDDVEDEYNEEVQLKKLNKLLGSDIKLSQNDLNYIRYALTAEGEEMTEAEYLAYGWNKGTEGTGMQLDRLLADKIGTILYDPENFDYDQFTVNVANLAAKYAAQSVDDGKVAIDKGLA